MTILGVRHENPVRAMRGTGRSVDVRRLGVRALGRVDVVLAVAARLAEAERLLPRGLHLLLIDAEQHGADQPDAAHHDSPARRTVDVTLTDDAGDPVWMGAIPIATGAAGATTSLQAARDHETDRRQRVLAHVMRTVGFAPRTDAWFRWEL